MCLYRVVLLPSWCQKHRRHVLNFCALSNRLSVYKSCYTYCKDKSLRPSISFDASINSFSTYRTLFSTTSIAIFMWKATSSNNIVSSRCLTMGQTALHSTLFLPFLPKLPQKFPPFQFQHFKNTFFIRFLLNALIILSTSLEGMHTI